MASFIYFYSKFTEEFLLLSAAGIFSFLAIYCYQWVVKKRRLGAARDQVPAGMVKIYLNQLIGEAQFVRTQLFGLLGGTDTTGTTPPPFHRMNIGAGASASEPSPNPLDSALAGGDLAQLPSDLADRIKALESQLREKEGMVVNVNIEKNKLLEEIETLRQSQKALPEGSGGASDELVKKIKALEERLEEYSVFEEDLANLKRLQQENTELKKRIEELLKGGATAPAPQAAAPAAAPTLALAPDPAPEPTAAPAAPQAAAAPAPANRDKSGLDPKAIENLLDGVPAVPPTDPAAPKAEASEPAVNPFASMAPPAPSAAPPPASSSPMPTTSPFEEEEAKAQNAAVPPTGPSVLPASGASAPKPDDFEKLVDSVETSLNKPEAPAPQVAATTAAPAPVGNPPPKVEGTPTVTKSDEELLKEFENLLNS